MTAPGAIVMLPLSNAVAESVSLIVDWRRSVVVGGRHVAMTAANEDGQASMSCAMTTPIVAVTASRKRR